MTEGPDDTLQDLPEEVIEVKYFDGPTSEPLEATLTELPLFPLQMVLNPGSNLPLHIFELRYRLMFNRIRDGDSRFGIVMYDETNSSLAQIGCSAELIRFEPLPDGRIMTSNIGRQRFRIVKVLEEKPFTRAMVEFLRDDKPTEDLSALVAEAWQVLQDVVRLINKLYDKVSDLGSDIIRLGPEGELAKAEESEWPSPQRLEDFSFAICQILDMPLKEQQILLQIRNTKQRLQRQLKMLQTARQYLAGQVAIKDAGLKGF